MLSAHAASLAGAGLMALTLVFGGRIHPLRALVRDHRAIVSFGAGIAAAYLFLGMMPELAEAMLVLEEGGEGRGTIVYLAALLGFVVFYGLDHTVRSGAGPDEGQVYGYGLYVFILNYALAAEAHGSVAATLWYAVAMCFHCLAIDHTLTERRGAAYDRRGRYLMALCVLLGWALAQIADLPALVTILALGFVSGALTVNSAIMELSEGVDGRFLPFALGCLFFAGLLVGVGMLP